MLCPSIKPRYSRPKPTRPPPKGGGRTEEGDDGWDPNTSIYKKAWDEAKAVTPGILTATGVFHVLDEVSTRAYLRVREKVRKEIDKGVKRDQGLFKWAKSNPLDYKPLVDPSPYQHKVLPAAKAAKVRLRGAVRGGLWFIPIIAGLNVYERRRGFGKKGRIPAKYKGQDPSKHSDLFTDENPRGTIRGLGFKNKKIALESIRKIKKERSHPCS